MKFSAPFYIFQQPMQRLNYFHCCYLIAIFIYSCKKDDAPPAPVIPPAPASFAFNSLSVNSVFNGFTYYNVNSAPLVKMTFTAALDPATVNTSVILKDNSGAAAPFTATIETDSILLITPAGLSPISKYVLSISNALRSKAGGGLQSPVAVNLTTALDSTDKFPRISDSALLTLVQQQTFKYFFDFAHPVSVLARERNTSGDVVTTGGSGFGVMALVTGVNRNFISRAQGLDRMTIIVNFLTNSAKSYHGAVPHWMNGATGATVNFSDNDDGADLVETSYLMQGLLTARQYFNGSNATETTLRSAINALYNKVEWNWFRQNAQNVLYWHWSPDKAFIINMPVKAWNEAMIVYALAASSPVDSNRITKNVYDSGWAANGAMKNGKQFYGITLPLGPDFGGPLFFAHYSFLGINPAGLTDAYADYWTQNQNHSLINYNYCITNPGKFNGYSSSVWGLTASDEENGYSAHSPTNDDGIISPTAAISSLPYTPVQSMNAIRFFYYTMGNKIWSQYGFTDAFNLTDIWFADTYLAIDQGPEIIMIENYRSGLLWNLFMSCPEIKTGMKSLGFQSPQLN